jgi:hypothetical protein
MKWNPVTGWKEPKWDRRTKSWARKWNEPELKTFIKAFLSFHYPDDADRLYDVYYSQGPGAVIFWAVPLSMGRGSPAVLDNQRHALVAAERRVCDRGCRIFIKQ